MRTRILGAVVLASLILGGQGTALAATPDVNTITCALDQGETLTALGLRSSEVEAPLLGSVYRQTSGAQETWETAYQTPDGRYWSRAGGNDVVAELVNPRNGFSFDVYKNNKLVSREQVSVCDPYVTIPLPTDEGEYTRSFRYSSDAGSGPASSGSFVIDRTAPVIAAVTRPAPGTADVTFSEPLVVSGAESHENWYIRSAVTMSDGVREIHTQVESVTLVDNSTRRLSYSPQVDAGFLGVDYALIRGERQADFAGNGLADTISFAPF